MSAPETQLGATTAFALVIPEVLWSANNMTPGFSMAFPAGYLIVLYQSTCRSSKARLRFGGGSKKKLQVCIAL